MKTNQYLPLFREITCWKQIFVFIWAIFVWHLNEFDDLKDLSVTKKPQKNQKQTTVRSRTVFTALQL